MKRRELIDREKLQQNKEIELDIRSTEMNEQKVRTKSNNELSDFNAYIISTVANIGASS